MKTEIGDQSSVFAAIENKDPASEGAFVNFGAAQIQWKPTRHVPWACWADKMRHERNCAPQCSGHPCGSYLDEEHSSGLCERHRRLVLPYEGDSRGILSHTHNWMTEPHTHAWGAVKHSHVISAPVCREPECEELPEHVEHPEGGHRASRPAQVGVTTRGAPYWVQLAEQRVNAQRAEMAASPSAVLSTPEN